MNKQFSSSVYSGFSLEQPRCPLTLRIMAYAIDLGVVTAYMYALFAIFGTFAVFSIAVIESLKPPELISRSLMIIGIALAVLIAFSSMSFYFVWHEMKFGATPGKKLLGLSVISTDGKKLTLRQCLYRDFMRLVDATLILPGLVCMILNDQNRRIGDLAAGTMVIYMEKNANEEKYLYIKQDEYLYCYEILKPLAPDIKIINSYLAVAINSLLKKSHDLSTLNEWESIARQHFQSEVGEKIDLETTLLFFAELCHQTRLEFKKNPGKEPTSFPTPLNQQNTRH